MLCRVEADQPLAVSVHHGIGGDHLGIEQRATRQPAMKEAAMPVRPFHHRRHGKAVRCHCFWLISVFGAAVIPEHMARTDRVAARSLVAMGGEHLSRVDLPVSEWILLVDKGSSSASALVLVDEAQIELDVVANDDRSRETIFYCLRDG